MREGFKEKGVGRQLSFGICNTGGRNNYGRTTVFQRGGGHKKKYRLIDFVRNINSFGVVSRVLYDPRRSGFIALVYYFNGIVSYILGAESLQQGDVIFSGASIPRSRSFFFYVQHGYLMVGNSVPLGIIPLGTKVHCIARNVGAVAKVARAAGAYGIFMKKDDRFGIIKLRSNMFIQVDLQCQVSIGIVSNFRQIGVNVLKAGRNRWQGFKPVVRGVAMNPIDHPHGGGQGKTTGGVIHLTPWGRITKGRATVHVKSKLLKYKTIY